MAIPTTSVMTATSLGSTPALQDFCGRWRIRDIRIEEHPYNGYGYIHAGEEEVKLTLSKRALEGLVRMDAEFERSSVLEEEEYRIRARCPAVRKAWEDYQLLLKLSK